MSQSTGKLTGKVAVVGPHYRGAEGLCAAGAVHPTKWVQAAQAVSAVDFLRRSELRLKRRLTRLGCQLLIVSQALL